ncbi:MAG: hypothetical protein KDE45_25115, partial [Caldilineaceae bacterium]|nr:hypothetical protein [Caldilineaceae bacterium]
ISDRVRQYQSAIDLMRSLRGIPTERDRLNARATQRISLNQGIGAFANQAADRNYAREQLTQLDAREAASAKGAFDAGQAQIKNAFEAQKLQQDRYKVTDPRYDSFGNQVAPGAIFDTRNGEYVNQPGGGAFQGQQPIGEAYAVNPDTGERIRYDHAKQEWVKAE